MIHSSVHGRIINENTVTERTLKRACAIPDGVQPKLPKLGVVQVECQSESDATRTKSNKEITIFRPSDFFYSYSRLINGLKQS